MREQSALHMAVLERLMTELDYENHKTVSIRPKGMPDASAGELFVAIWGDGSRPGPAAGSTARDELFGFNITVSKKGNKAPIDRWGDDIIVEEREGLYQHVQPIVNLLDGSRNSIAYLSRANDFLTDGNVGGPTGRTDKFIVGIPVRCQGADFDVKPASWWSGHGDWAGVSSTIRFFGARRIQSDTALRLK